MQNKNEKISRHCGHGSTIQGRYKEKTSLLNRLDCGSTPGMTTRKAFTLIELLVVVLIIGILAAVAVPQYQKAVDKARLIEALVLGKHIRDLEETYYLANGNYTNSFVDLGMDIPAKYALDPNYSDNRRINSARDIIELEKGTNNRAKYFYRPKGQADLGLFFWYQNSTLNGKIQCHPYTDYGTELCKILNL